ncbi:hypothetical protein Scani_51510 [Streptomyces caniferus]|uniref:Recombination endonuclease VII n=1 Tax=Streptomyces caniferus TaxID=285557 RepID=A0A640SBZ4_9ACTN|nr:hypothetical protein Scani_51510 [Streptomyces caniferus]
MREKADVPPGHTRCRACGKVPPRSEWHGKATASDGLPVRRTGCRAVHDRAGPLERHHGRTVAERDAMIKERSGICPICVEPGREHVDHDRDTGKVRGVLCFNCNSALGKLRDDPDALRRAIAYLEGNVWKPIFEAPGVYQLPS